MVNQPTRPHWSQVRTDNDNVNLREHLVDYPPKGLGTEAKPFLVSSTNDFLRIGTGNWTMDSYYKQVADIDFDGVDFTPVGHVAGSGYTAFTGSYDGNGHVISNIEASFAGDSYIGLFARASAATFTSIGVENSYFQGGAAVGGILGRGENSVTIKNCYVASTTVFGDRTANTTVSTGGICGLLSDSTMSETYFHGVVNTGLTNSIHTGGLIGLCRDTDVADCWSSVTGTNNLNMPGLLFYDGGTITDCVWNADNTTTGLRDGGADMTITNTTGASTSTMYTLANYTVDNSRTWDFIDTWQIIEDASYPYFQYRLAQSPAPAE